MMAKHTEVQPSLFDDDGEVSTEAPKKKVLLPTKDEVSTLAKKTGESPRKCYFWILAEKNKEKS
jgi:hypothetical protein